MRLAALFIALLAVGPVTSAVAQQLPASKKDRSDVVKYAVALESDPLSKQAKKNRVKVLTIINRSPDLLVPPCRALLGELLLSKQLGAAELRVQLQISAAKYLAEHPGASPDQEEALAAGLDGALTAYASMHNVNPLIQIDVMDELTERRARGEIRDVVRDALADCEA